MISSTDIRVARIMADPAHYGAVVAAVFVADADLQAQDSQNAYRVLCEALYRTQRTASREKLTIEQSVVLQRTLDAVAGVLVRNHTSAFVQAAVAAELHLGMNNPSAAYHSLAAVMSMALGGRNAA